MVRRVRRYFFYFLFSLGVIHIVFSEKISSSFGFTLLLERDSRGNYTVAHWSTDSFPIQLYVERELRFFKRGEALKLVERAARMWREVPGVELSFRIGELSEEIDSSNFRKFLHFGDHKVEFIFDLDGKILTELGLNPKYIAGISVPITSANSRGKQEKPFLGEIIDGFSVINLSLLSENTELLLRIVAHELGHLLGLGHTNVYLPSSREDLPLMYYNPFTQSGRPELSPDDRAAIVSLYPAKEFESLFGAVKGELIRRRGTPLFGGLIMLIPERGRQPIATWSMPDGSFHLSGIPPGRYYILFQTLDFPSNFNSPKPEKHFAGLLRGSQRSFCPEYYNDRQFINCISPPKKRDLIEIKPGRTLELGTIAEYRAERKRTPRCVVGAWPSFPGYLPNRKYLSERVDGLGKRGNRCPKLPLGKREKFPEYRKSEFYQDEVLDNYGESARDGGRSEAERFSDLPSLRVVDKSCACSSNSGIPLLFLLILIQFLISVGKRYGAKSRSD